MKTHAAFIFMVLMVTRSFAAGPPELPDRIPDKTDAQVEQELETAIAEEKDTPLDKDWFWDWLIAGAIVAILLGLYFWTRK